MKASGDGGKGSVRRNEDTQKVLEGFTRIFGESKLDKKLREERSMMNDDPQERSDEDYERSEEEMWEICPACSGSGEGMYEGSTCHKCKGYGEISTQEKDGDDYDYED